VYNRNCFWDSSLRYQSAYVLQNLKFAVQKNKKPAHPPMADSRRQERKEKPSSIGAADARKTP